MKILLVPESGDTPEEHQRAAAALKAALGQAPAGGFEKIAIGMEGIAAARAQARSHPLDVVLLDTFQVARWGALAVGAKGEN